MEKPLFPVCVVMRRVPIINRWVSEKWELAGVDPDAGANAISCTALAGNAWLWRGFTLDLHPSEAEGYYLNLSAPDPRVFVMWRLEEWEGVETARPWVTTASYHEAARMMDGGETVDSLPMPAAVREWMQPWLEANYKPEPRRKNRRNEDFWGDKAPVPASATGSLDADRAGLANSASAAVGDQVPIAVAVDIVAVAHSAIAANAAAGEGSKR